ncbi:hypothetical protein [Trujillonella humicola]|uniref:hypothetical protein n=1 Tax=Trujillonella humicola TaxID=3383699 RepID=UPI003906C227
MRQVSRRALVAAAVGSALVTGCTSTVEGAAAFADPVTDVPAEDFPITGATDSDVDRYARNALDDLVTFWEQAYPEAYGEPFTPLEGGFFSVDSEDLDESRYPDHGIGCPGSPTDPEEVAGNAFYDPNCDVIAFDTALLAELGEEYGPFIGPAVMAHEMGHAMQFRFGYNDSSIQDETQADCFAGAFTRWVADGNGAHVAVRRAEIDPVVLGFLGLRDDVGSDPEDELAHGSGFDRVSGFLSGYEDGVTSCRDDFGTDRVFTQVPFTEQEDYANDGNAPYGDVPALVEATLPVFYESFVDGFEPPAVETFDGTAPDCGDMGAEDRDVGFCPADGTVYADGTDLLEPAYDDIGDFAVVTAIALPYAEAARAALGLPTGTPEATVSAVCLTGTYTARVFSGDFYDPGEQAGVLLSPGDVDEAVLFLLAYGQTAAVLPHTDATGFELVGAFRAGFLQGAGSCGL